MRLGALRLPNDLAAADEQALRRVRARLLLQISAPPGAVSLVPQRLDGQQPAGTPGGIEPKKHPHHSGESGGQRDR